MTGRGTPSWRCLTASGCRSRSSGRNGASALVHQTCLSPWQALRHLDFLREQRYDNHNIEAMEWELDGRNLKVTTTVGPDLTVVDEESVRHEVRQIAANNLADTAEIMVRKFARAEIVAVLPPTDCVGVQVLIPHDSGRGTTPISRRTRFLTSRTSSTKSPSRRAGSSLSATGTTTSKS
ncbi:hypothetical protein [Candidatus Amarobacter glycogenicus]|uniref:hypothetical protein n=1 Tax=Candidatus Amarobacter glycogenicus TaxID=3140699 RepID=UPI003135AD24|nr:hypothetical protein [Dehalococcoidia bacterium]